MHPVYNHVVMSNLWCTFGARKYLYIRKMLCLPLSVDRDVTCNIRFLSAQFYLFNIK